MKISKSILEKLTQEEINEIESTWNSESKLIRESVESKMIKKSDYEQVQNELNTIKTEGEVNSLLKNVPKELQDLFKPQLIGAENKQDKLNELTTTHKELIEKIGKLDTPSETNFAGTMAEVNKKVNTPKDDENLTYGSPVYPK